MHALWQACAWPDENSRTDYNSVPHTAQDWPLFRFQEQKLPANGHSNAREMALLMIHQALSVWRMAIRSFR
jgi:hypothetical protein